MLNLDYEKMSHGFDSWLGNIGTIITVITPIVAYFKFNSAFQYVVSFLLVLTVVRNLYLGNKFYQSKKENTQLKSKLQNQENNTQLESDFREAKDRIVQLENENEGYKKGLERTHNDLLEGKLSSDILLNYYIDEVDNQCIKYTRIDVDAQIIYKQKSKYYDVKYLWSVKGQNPSKQKFLSSLSFMISGDSIIKNNNDLNMIIKLKTSNGNWQQVNGFINGYDKIKFLHITLNDYKIFPNYPFEIKFSYIWPQSYVANGADRFSFGTNTFSSTEPYDLGIKVHGNKKCFSSAFQQIRYVEDSFNINEQPSQLSVLEQNEENVITTLLPASNKSCAIYIELIP